eukprot:jgi/Picsp_1/3823/NSC_01335-R1_colon cancer-associated protein mic1-like containing expressed
MWIVPTIVGKKLDVSLPMDGEGVTIWEDEYAGWVHAVEGRMVSAIRLEERLHGEEGMQFSEEEGNRVVLKQDGATDSESTSSYSEKEWDQYFLAPEGPQIRRVCSSPDGVAGMASFTALQRGSSHVEVFQHATGQMFVLYPQTKEAFVVGVFWMSDRTVVVVSSHGVELYHVGGEEVAEFCNGEAWKISTVQWFQWSFPSKLLLLGCGSNGARVQGMQLLASGIVRLPDLDLSPPWGSPVKIKGRISAPWRLASHNVFILLCYERIFIAYWDPIGNNVMLFRVYKDAMSLVARIDIPVCRGRVNITVMENLILLHVDREENIFAFDLAEYSTYYEKVKGKQDIGKTDSGSLLCLDPRKVLAVQPLFIASSFSGLGAGFSPIKLWDNGLAMSGEDGSIYSLKMSIQECREAVFHDYDRLCCFLHHRILPLGGHSPAVIITRVIQLLVQNRQDPSRFSTIFDSIYCFKQPLIDPTDVVVEAMQPLLQSDIGIEDTDEQHHPALKDYSYMNAILSTLLSACYRWKVPLNTQTVIFELYLHILEGLNALENMPLYLASFSKLFDSAINAYILENKMQVLGREKQLETKKFYRYFQSALEMRRRLKDPAGLCRVHLMSGNILQALRLVQQNHLQGVIDKCMCLELVCKSRKLSHRELELLDAVFSQS